MEQLKPVKSGKVKVDDVKLYYEIYGQGDPLVFVAGTGISCAPWRVSQVPEFAKHYQVVIYDHRGLGHVALVNQGRRAPGAAGGDGDQRGRHADARGPHRAVEARAPF